MVDRYRIWPEGFAAHMRPAKPVDMVFADEHDAEIAALKAENEEQRERLVQFANAFDAGYAAAERALAERAGGVKVKALEWDRRSVDGSNEYADSLLGEYQAWAIGGSGYFYRKAFATGQLAGDTIETAKAAAQADYERRILSTLEPAAPEGRQEAVAWQHIPGCGTDRESKMVSVSEGVFCDPCIAPLVAALNAAGFATVASCCGHGHRPGVIALRDGRELFIAKDFNEARQIDAIFPIDINGNTRPAEQAVTDEIVAKVSHGFLKKWGFPIAEHFIRDILKAAMEAGG